MAFIDFLAFEEALLIFAAVIVGYIGVATLLAMRKNDADGVKSALKSGAVPLGAVGATATILGVWGEITWQYPAPYLTGYNILFNDVYLLFGLTLVVLAVSMATNSKLQYAGLFAMVAGGITLSYGWNGYILSYTKDPLETLLLYAGFGLAGILSFPATLLTDHYLAHPTSSLFVHPVTEAVARRRSIQSATRAVQPVVPVATSGASEEKPSVSTYFHLPIYVSTTMLIFVAMMALAGIAAIYYLNATLPGHLASAP